MSDEFDRTTLPDDATLQSDLPVPQEIKNPRSPLTVGELKKALEDLEDDLVVASEGCDCVGVADSPILYDGEVLIRRYEEYIYE